MDNASKNYQRLFDEWLNGEHGTPEAIQRSKALDAAALCLDHSENEDGPCAYEDGNPCLIGA